MSAMMESRNLVLSRRWRRPIVLALFVATLGLAGCNHYEPKQTIEGVYRPRPDCANLQGHRDDWLSFSTVYPTVCKPIRVSELGNFTYGGNWSSAFQTVEMGRLEFSDGGVYVKTEALNLTGNFEYRAREATLDDWTRQNPFTTVLLVLVGLTAGVTIPLGLNAIASKRRRERERLEAEVAREAAARAAETAARVAARAAALAQLQRLISEAKRAAASLAIILGEAELALNRADEELRSQLPSPFWEAMEEAVEKLQAFQGAMSIIESRRAEYSAQASTLDGGTPEFRLGVAVLPDPTNTQSRLTHLYRQAQAIPHFSLVYEQRRTTSTLVAGFRSLGQAVERLGHRIVNEIGSLAASMDSRLDSLEKSLESSAAAAAEQSAALRTQLESAVGSSDSLSRQLRQDAEAHSETERRALRMLDNIQHRRKPSIFDPP